MQDAWQNGWQHGELEIPAICQDTRHIAELGKSAQPATFDLKLPSGLADCKLASCLEPQPKALTPAAVMALQVCLHHWPPQPLFTEKLWRMQQVHMVALDTCARAEIIRLAKEHPELSHRAIAKRVKCTGPTVKTWLLRSKSSSSLANKKSSGRKKLVTPAVAEFLQALLQEKGSSSSVELASKAQAKFKVKISPTTVQRHLRQNGCKYGSPKKVVLLQARHKETRLKWARHHLSQRTSFVSYMFSDSKIFLLSDVHSGGKLWYAKGERPQVAVPKNSQGVHVYVGVTNYGITKPCFVTGAGSQVSPYINPSTKRAFSGVCALEYQEVVLPHLIEGGDRLFRPLASKRHSWVLQQDNASPHVARATKALMDARLPNRWVKDWPALSPDLSWVENIWALCMRRLQDKRDLVTDINSLKRELTAVLASTELDTLQKHVLGMPGRLQAVIQAAGGPI